MAFLFSSLFFTNIGTSYFCHQFQFYLIDDEPWCDMETQLIPYDNFFLLFKTIIRERLVEFTLQISDKHVKIERNCINVVINFDLMCNECYKSHIFNWYLLCLLVFCFVVLFLVPKRYFFDLRIRRTWSTSTLVEWFFSFLNDSFIHFLAGLILCYRQRPRRGKKLWKCDFR